jgi:histidine decarboxylase
MWTKGIPHASVKTLNNQKNDYKALLQHIDTLAQNKLGYPVSLLTYLGVIDNKFLGIRPGSLANVLLNNVGDPFKDSETSLMEVKGHERELIAILEKYYGLPKDGARGYVTTGGTEGNFAALWWSKRFLISNDINTLIQYDDSTKQLSKTEQALAVALTKIPLNDYRARAEHLQKMIDIKNKIEENRNIVQQLLTPTVFYSKGITHYSVPKISEIQRVNIRPVQPNPDGSINLNDFQKELLLHLEAHPHSPVIVVANIGTTVSGAIDDIPGIKKILDSAKRKPKYTIHADGALTGFVLPIIKPFGDVPNYFDAIGVNTLAVSAHKYPGLSQPCGIVLARREFFEKAFEKSERSIDYVGNILDVTITGSRSGLNVLMFYNALRTLGLDKGSEKLKSLLAENDANARYLRDQLVSIYGEDKVSYPFHFNVSFPRTSLALAKKFQLMLTGNTATICVLTNASKTLIDKFIVELKLEVFANNHPAKEDLMGKVIETKKTKSGYKLCTLGREHMQSAAELFTKSFCDDEPITKHLGIQYSEYEPFVLAVIQKAVKDGLSVVAVDDANRVVACAIGEDIADPFKPNLVLYPKMKPIFAIMEALDEPFFQGKTFKKGKLAHTWIAMVAKDCRGKGLSTEIDLACTNHIASKGYDFTYAEFTNDISEKITHHYPIAKKINEIAYANFTYKGQKPFQGVNGGTAAYILGISPTARIENLKDCYTSEKTTTR